MAPTKSNARRITMSQTQQGHQRGDGIAALYSKHIHIYYYRLVSSFPHSEHQVFFTTQFI